jgi:hypothetical protein
MAHIHIYACTKADFTDHGNKFVSGDELPSPTDLKRSDEQIWSENTGRAQSGANKAKMIGDSITGNKTVALTWGILTDTEMSTIRSKLKRGFFVFGYCMSITTASDSAITAYRGDISAQMFSAGGAVYHKNASVSIIEQ